MQVQFHKLEDRLPAQGAKVEWISPTGAVSRGTFLGAFITDDGSPARHRPVFWRYI